MDVLDTLFLILIILVSNLLNHFLKICYRNASIAFVISEYTFSSIFVNNSLLCSNVTRFAPNKENIQVIPFSLTEDIFCKKILWNGSVLKAVWWELRWAENTVVPEKLCCGKKFSKLNRHNHKRRINFFHCLYYSWSRANMLSSQTF